MEAERRQMSGDVLDLPAAVQTQSPERELRLKFHALLITLYREGPFERVFDCHAGRHGNKRGKVLEKKFRYIHLQVDSGFFRLQTAERPGKEDLAIPGRQTALLDRERSVQKIGLPGKIKSDVGPLRLDMQGRLDAKGRREADVLKLEVKGSDVEALLGRRMI